MNGSDYFDQKLQVIRKKIIEEMGDEGISLMANIDNRIREKQRESMEAAERLKVLREKEIKEYNDSDGDLKSFQCEKCRNKGYVAIPYDNWYHLIPCDCMKSRISINNLKYSGLVDMVERHTFENFDTSQLHTKKMLNTAKNFLCSKDWLFVAGQVGCGKTHICTAVCGELLKSMHEVVYMLWRDESVRLKTMINEPEYTDMIAKFKNAEILYIDDFLKTNDNSKPADADIKLAFEIINSRYNQGKQTIFSCEWYINDILRFDEALGSRIYERSKDFMVEIGKDQKKNWRLR